MALPDAHERGAFADGSVRRRPLPLLIGAIALLIFWVPVSEASGAPAELDVGEILEHVIRTTEFPPGVGFRQEIVLKALFFHLAL